MAQKTHIPQSNRTNVHNPKSEYPFTIRTNVHNSNCDSKSEYPFKKRIPVHNSNHESQFESRFAIRMNVRSPRLQNPCHLAKTVPTCKNHANKTPLTLLDPSNSLRGIYLPRPGVCMSVGSYVSPREASSVRKLAQDQVKGGESDDS